jgi:hypothetical protein
MLFMTITSAAATLGAALLLAGAPAVALASAAPASDPIAISDTQVQPADGGHGNGTGFVSVAFDNTSNQVATEVVFELDVDGAYTDHFNDVGTFTPGTTIRHAFQTDSSEADQQLKVAAVKFADGTVWVSDSGNMAPELR